MSLYDQESPYDPELNPRWLGEAEVEPDDFDPLELGARIAHLADRQRVFRGEGWPTLKGDIEKRIRDYEVQLRSVRTMDAVNETRGAIRALEWLLGLEETTDNELRLKNQQYQETEAAP